MKYLVKVNGREFGIEVRGNDVVVNGVAKSASLTGRVGSPLKGLHKDGRSLSMLVEVSNGEWLVQCDGVMWVVELEDERDRLLARFGGGSGASTGGGVLTAPMPGLVLRILVDVGQTVVKGQGLIVLEAMKMENEIRAPADGVVTEVRAAVGTPVERGAPLVYLSPVGEA